MTGIDRALTMACGDCAPAHPLPEHHSLMVVLLIVGIAAIGVAIVAWQLRRKRPPARVTSQWSALTLMGELCPYGWKAEITLHGPQPTPDAGEPSPNASPVALTWDLYEPGSDRVAVTRQASAGTIDEALQTMVDQRRLDFALEQIERSAEGRDRR